MKAVKHIFFLFAAASLMAACDHSNIPSGPAMSTETYDTLDCSGLDLPAGAITVREALKIGKKVPYGGVSENYYYIKGYVTGLDNSLDKYGKKKHESGMLEFGNGVFYIQDNTNTMANFYCYRTKGLPGVGFTSLDQLQVGDFVVVKCKINNYNGTMETDYSTGSNIVYSSNDLVYPFKDVTYFQDNFKQGLVNWTQQVISGSIGDIWVPTTTINPAYVVANAGQETGESWLISSAFKVEGPHQNPVKLFFSHGFYKSTLTKDQAPQYLRAKVRVDNGAWIDLPNCTFKAPSKISYNSAADSLDITAYANGMVQVAFAYKSDETYKPQWKISNIEVREKKRQRTSFK